MPRQRQVWAIELKVKTRIDDGRWHHIVVKLDLMATEQKVVLYVDGVDDAPRVSAGTLMPANAILTEMTVGTYTPPALPYMIFTKSLADKY